MSALALARVVYRLLVHDRPQGMTREALTVALGTNDRTMRDAVNLCRTLAATHPLSTGETYIIGWDPECGRYVAARDPHTARRIIDYQASRVEDINRALDLQRAAYERRWGPYRAAEQKRLL